MIIYATTTIVITHVTMVIVHIATPYHIYIYDLIDPALCYLDHVWIKDYDTSSFTSFISGYHTDCNGMRTVPSS